MIHLKHAEHGFTIAYTEADAKANEKNGWKRCDINKEFAAARKAKAKAAKEELAAMDNEDDTATAS